MHSSARWFTISFMAQFPTTEGYIKKVCRIAKELDISIDEAAMTCDAFELAFSDHETRRAIFGMIDQLDESAARKGEPSGLIITYAVEIGADGIHVGRYADYVPPDETLELTPANQAMIFLRITDDFPTQEVLGCRDILGPSTSVRETRYKFCIGFSLRAG